MITMLNGLGMCLISLKSKSKLATVPTTLLLGGTGAFSGLIFYEAWFKDRQFHNFIKYGGTATILGWFTMALL